MTEKFCIESEMCDLIVKRRTIFNELRYTQGELNKILFNPFKFLNPFYRRKLRTLKEKNTLGYREILSIEDNMVLLLVKCINQLQQEKK